MNKKIDPDFYKVCLAYEESDHFIYGDVGISEPETWGKFLDECGLVQIRFSAVEVVNKKKFLIAKIKYGI